MERLTLLACCAVAMAWAAGCEPEAMRTGPDVTPSLAPVRFQATIYEVRLKADRVAHLDAEHLAATAGTGADFEKTLADMGETRTLYRVDQAVNLVDDRIHIGKREPFVTGTRTTQAGGTINKVQYQEIGVIFQVSAKPTDRGLAAKVEVEMSALTDSATPVAEKVPALSIHHVSLRHNGPVELGRPVVMASVDASTRDAQGGAIAYVCRIVFSAPAP